MFIFYRIALATLACVPIDVLCQSLYLPTGARSSSLGNASVTLRDHWSVINNIAGTGFVKDTAIAVTFENRYGISNLNSAALIGLIPYKRIVVAFTLGRFGDQLYSEQNLGIGAAHRISNVSLGFKLNYFQIRADEATSRHALIAEFGGIAEINKTLLFGAHIYNLTQSSFKMAGSKIALPVVMKAGLSYLPHHKITVSIEAYKAALFKASVRMGLEYFIIEKLCLRAGVSTVPYINYFGAGFRYQKFELDYSFSFHNILGAINQISLSYKFRSKHL